MLDKSPVHENVSSAISYGTGGFAYLIGTLPQIADTSQHLAVIIGLFVIVIRAVHDFGRMIRFFVNWRAGVKDGDE